MKDHEGGSEWGTGCGGEWTWCDGIGVLKGEGHERAGEGFVIEKGVGLGIGLMWAHGFPPSVDSCFIIPYVMRTSSEGRGIIFGFFGRDCG